MKTRTLLFAAAVALGVLAWGVIVEQRRHQTEPVRIAAARAPAPTPSLPATESPPSARQVAKVVPPLLLLVEMPRPTPPQRAGPAPTLPDSPVTFSSGKEAPLDPLARVALFMVGSDPDAEEYWRAAINDPSLPAEERQDLIEDLNEDGLSDPEHPTADDLPLILSRLRLIEEVSEEAMDEVNADAFQEAYKDLLHLARLASGGRLP